MITIKTISEMRAFSRAAKAQKKTVGFVPTMGALHRGHQKLLETCTKKTDITVLSVFVNPTQFAPGEDFEKYPRTVESDQKIGVDSGVDVFFLPDIHEIYPSKPSVFVEPSEHLSKVLCGPFRPGHFRGVCTVVNKLLNIVEPDELCLGQKDAQQLRIIEEMALQFLIPTKIVAVPTVRETNGLAMSSRNQYLSVDEKNRASVIYKSLIAAQKKFESGEKNPEVIVETSKKILREEDSFTLQYIELVRWSDFSRVGRVDEKSLLAIAGFFGKTRLIDNMILS